MPRRSIAIAFAVTSLICTQAIAALADDNHKTIPLDEIWGYNLPGTRDIAGIPFPDKPQGGGQTLAVLNREREYNIEQIRIALAIKNPAVKATAGFVVQSKLDSRILPAVLSQLRGKPNPFQREFLEGKELTLVFFSHPTSYYARLRKVEVQGKEISVHYQFEPHPTPEVTSHFALIPLGKLEAGKYGVAYKQIPIEPKYRDTGFEPVPSNAPETVSRDFSFVVAGPPKDEPPLQGATTIPLDQVWGFKLPGTRDIYRLLAGDMRNQLYEALHKPREAGPAFVVAGKDETALQKAILVLAQKTEPERVFSDGNLSLVFFSYTNGAYYVRIDRVEQAKQMIVVSYRFVHHRTQDSSYHFALIPLQLAPGNYDVEIRQLPVDGISPARDMGGRVCGSTSFQVKGEP